MAAPLTGLPTATATGYYEALRRQYQVEYLSTASLLSMALPAGHGAPDINVDVIGSLDAEPGTIAGRVRVLAGRMFNPANSGGVMSTPS